MEQEIEQQRNMNNLKLWQKKKEEKKEGSIFYQQST